MEHDDVVDVVPRVRPPDAPRARRPAAVGRPERRRDRAGLRRGAVADVRGVGGSHDILARFARHYQTGEVIPEGAGQADARADEFGIGLQAVQQMFYAAMSLGVLRPADPARSTPTRVHGGHVKTLHPVRVRRRHALPSRFGHLDGYSALYYTYMWSLVIAKDLFTPFDAKNLLDPGGTEVPQGGPRAGRHEARRRPRRRLPRPAVQRGGLEEVAR